MVTDARQAAAFTKVEVGDGIGVTVTVGPAQSVTISAQQNLLTVIATDVDAGTLKIKGRSPYTTDAGLSVRIVTPALDGIVLSGGSQGRAEGLNAAAFVVQLSGGAVLSASGTATAVTLMASGGSRALLEALAARTATVDASGGSTVNIQASETVTGSAAGGSHVTVTGGAKVDINTSGGSSVSKP